MAARVRRPFHNQKSREAIQTTQLIKRLMKHVNGEIELSATQVRGIEILLRKTLPDLTATEWQDITERSVDELSRDELLSIAATGGNGTAKKAGLRAKPDPVH